MNFDEINKELSGCPETAFDTFDIKMDLRKSGAALREDLVRFTNMFSLINQYASHANLMYEQAKIRRDVVEGMAWASLPSDMKVTIQRKVVSTTPVEYAGEKTTLQAENLRLSLYSYVADRGRDKVKEVIAVLDVGRTLLSWDKSEQGRSF